MTTFSRVWGIDSLQTLDLLTKLGEPLPRSCFQITNCKEFLTFALLAGKIQARLSSKPPRYSEGRTKIAGRMNGK